MLTRHIHAFLHMRCDDEAAHRRHEPVMLVVLGMLVFDEIFGFADLSHVMVIGADACEKRIFADGLGCCFGQVADKDAVMIGPGAFVDQFFEQRLVRVQEFEELDIRGDIEDRFKKRQGQPRRSWSTATAPGSRRSYRRHRASGAPPW